MKNSISILPLKWEPHPSMNNGWYGYTTTGAQIVYVYPVSCHTRPRRPWAVFQYWGANPDRDGEFGEVISPKTGKPVRYATGRQAKRAAQRYWKRQVLALLRFNT